LIRRLGFACLCTALENSSPRGTILRNATSERLRELIGTNLDRLGSVLRFNVAHGIRLFRISSDMIPFGSHPVNRTRWWEEFGEQLEALGAYIRRHDLRVSVHPGQHTVLAAIEARVVQAAVDDLVYHGLLLDALGLDWTHKIVIHVGGAYGDKPAALRRWAARFAELPESVQGRLVVENDERLFGVEDVLGLSGETGAPVVFDALHHAVYAGLRTADGDAELSCVLQRVFATWRPERDGVPKMHFSSQAAGQRPGAHAAHVEADDFRSFLQRVPAESLIDCMLEAKAKEQALFRLREALGPELEQARQAATALAG
jgi:UV DNA damage endonuclease